MDLAVHGSNPVTFMVRDVSRACSYAQAIRLVYVKMIDEDQEPGDADRCGRLHASMYGTRGAALNWHMQCNEHLEKIGFEQGRSNPCIFYSKEENIRAFIHGHDCVAGGDDASLQWMMKAMQEKYECKVHILAPVAGGEFQVKVLNRTITWHKHVN